mmetsp:Transcript_47396/g.71752  ORF Transcript_47396/g.71752 Transcript_47396/m.71752 type:complete len:143 (+) Transcript_47396:160-588(+)
MREKKLEELGFDWDKEGQLNIHRAREANVVPWSTRIKQLILYKSTNDHLKIPHKYRGEQNLGTWAANVRIAFRKWSRGEKFSGNFTKENFDQVKECETVLILISFSLRLNSDYSGVAIHAYSFSHARSHKFYSPLSPTCNSR